MCIVDNLWEMWTTLWKTVDKYQKTTFFARMAPLLCA